ncbi:inositol monophosphatase family protein [Corynebacterium uberis]|uniref:inositol monophosphatase family protein n=1 Tax=Corynebacterium TaxID=1716 RepID=UPI001D0BD25F|nr:MULTISPECIES: inositol monophosphatase [Corynebacterium]MCZ9308366.1 inositol monophosphatase [Corynebacterium sp. c6VSa_13]UDL74037.1 inositol monophosphatase [Corynebacterium uberis]UDL75079.1 inositol monophosphatase [Corynebacterium uberis]UDL77292.1 inositol monophosphatase [Corynebacterium uberis]UDL79576.1 inositol monophosphatase [Corynebacterium uberis]
MPRLAHELPALHQWAQEILDETQSHFLACVGSRPAWLKAPGDFATKADLDIEAFLRRRLTEATGIPVLGEETGGTLGTDPVWVVDPIDGTANFAAGNPLCAILVSLLIDAQPVLGLTAVPVLHRRLSAIAGGPLLVDGTPMPPLRDSSNLTAQVGFSSVASPDDSSFPSMVRQGLLARLAETYLRPRITGSVGVDLAFVAQGIFGGAVSLSPHVWDNAAGVALIRAAGGVVTGVDGEEWTADSEGVVAGTRSAHAAIMDAIRQTTTEVKTSGKDRR